MEKAVLMMAKKVLIVEDDSNIAELLNLYLEKEGFEPLVAKDGGKGVEQFQPDLVLLDIMLPVMDGWSVLKKIRESSKVPVIMLTAKGETSDKVSGLEMGADDYIVKPFEIIELLARVETVLRRYNKTARILSVYDVTVDTFSRVVKKGGQPVSLTAKEYDILLLFLRNKNIALFRDRIYESVWGEMYMGESRTVDLHVQRMRKKVGLETKIVPVYKIGYRLEVDE